LKINWALREPIPWQSPDARRAGTVHLGVDMDGLTFYAASLAARRIPSEPFVVLGQMTTSDASRSPAGTESAWAYTHLPERIELRTQDIDEHVARIEAVIERHAPAFRARIAARTVQTPAGLQDGDPNLVGGAINAGTAGLHQQLIFRPVPGLGRAETVIDRLYLAGASAHPGGGVHGTCGANAARAALADSRPTGWPRRKVLARLHSALYDTDR
jgi:phytoene dehydrogenase-like protein